MTEYGCVCDAAAVAFSTIGWWSINGGIAMEAGTAAAGCVESDAVVREAVLLQICGGTVVAG